MANTIKIKRRPASGAAGKPSSLYNGELAFNENDNILYYGYGSGVGGAASSIEQIGGTGYFAHRGGTNASGLWPVSVTGNASTVTNGVYTTGNQTIDGFKTFGNTTTFNSGISAVAINTSSNSVGYFAVFDSDPNSTSQTLKSVSKDVILDDIGAATSGLDITAGSGLIGGGTLSQNRRFDIGQGDGISVNADSIAVDNTVVRTTGTQSIDGTKTFTSQSFFNDYANFGSGINVSAGINYLNGVTQIQSQATASTVTNIPVFISSPSAGTQTIFTRTPSELKGDIGLSNVTNDAQIKKLASVTSGNIPFWNGTTGDLLANGYGVETVLTGSSVNLPRADAVKTYVDNMITSGIATNDAMIFKGAIDCSTNPNYPAADRGWTYKVSVAGKIGGASGPVVEVNDTLICTTDGTSAGNHATVGSNWTILQTNIVDSSILVTGPSSATSGNFAIFDGTTGKIIKDSSLNSNTFANAVHTHSSFPYLSLGDGTVGDGSLSIITPDSWTQSERQDSFTFTINTDASAVFNINALGQITHGSWKADTIGVDKGGTGQTSYTNGQLLIGNTTGNTLTKATLSEGTAIDITNGAGSITIAHEDTSTLTGAQGSNGIASITVDGMGHVTAVTTATYLTAGTVCAAIVDCSLDGGSF